MNLWVQILLFCRFHCRCTIKACICVASTPFYWTTLRSILAANVLQRVRTDLKLCWISFSDFIYPILWILFPPEQESILRMVNQVSIGVVTSVNNQCLVNFYILYFFLLVSLSLSFVNLAVDAGCISSNSLGMEKPLIWACISLSKIYFQ